jgi:phosphoserine phosphatase
MEASQAQTLPAASTAFMDGVLRLRPRVAAFDCDGTLWSGDAGETFFRWEMETGLVSPEVSRAMRARYADYKAGKVTEDEMCGEMVTMHRGMAESELMRAAERFLAISFPGRIFPEVQELVRRLQEQGCEVWAVSSSNEWVIRVAMRQFGIPEERVLATAVEIENGIATDRLIRIPSGPGKPQALRDVAKKQVDAAFGNSRWDADMLAMAQHAFAVNPNPDLAALAGERGWSVYLPDGIGPRL